MGRKQFTTSIDENASKKFKIACGESGIKMNIVLEIFMKAFVSGQFELKLSKDKVDIEEVKK